MWRELRAEDRNGNWYATANSKSRKRFEVGKGTKDGSGMRYREDLIISRKNKEGSRGPGCDQSGGADPSMPPDEKTQ